MSGTLADESEALARWAKIALVVVGVFVVSLFQSCQELTWIASGEKTQAQVESVREVTVRGRFSSSTRIEVAYSFQVPSAGTVQGSGRVGSSWRPRDDGTVGVTYLPDDPRRSVITSERSRVWLWVLLAMIGVAAWGCWRLWVQAGLDSEKERRLARRA